jgi:voltage-gated potassium channel
MIQPFRHHVRTGRSMATARAPGPAAGRDREPAQPELNSGVLPGNVHLDDWVLLALAVLSVGLLSYLLISPPDYQDGLRIFYADCAVCGIFLIEFLRRWRKRGWPLLRRSWYEVFAMLPVAHPALLDHRFLLSVLLVVRVGRGLDRALGEQFALRLAEKLADPIVRVIKKPITLAVLDEVVGVLETGNYPENLARSLTENQDELRRIISEKLAADPQIGRLSKIPYYDEIVHSTVDTVFRVLLDVLRDPRIDDFFASVVRDNRVQIRQAVALGLNDPPPDAAEQEGLLATRTERSAARAYDRHHPRPGAGPRP